MKSVEEIEKEIRAKSFINYKAQSVLQWNRFLAGEFKYYSAVDLPTPLKNNSL